MKCDELKPLVFSLNELSFIDEPEANKNFENPHAHAVYKATEVDAAIEELKAAHHKERHEYIKMIAELKQNLEDAKATAFAESVDAGMENRRLKRALWLSRADRAIMTLEYFTLKCIWFQDVMKVEPPKCDVKMIHKWANIECKCRSKMEKYK